jgi:mannitol/fructose-specific phosphotransferase system IIA component (Ntr-type)
MKFSVFISPKAIRSKLAASTKEGVISEMVDALVEAGEVKESDRPDIIKAIMQYRNWSWGRCSSHEACQR